MNKNIFVRDTLVTVSAYNALSAIKQQQITDLVKEFNGLGYIDARTELGPDQAARMSNKQRQKLTDTANKAFSIEMKIKKLLTPDDVIKKHDLLKQKEQLKSAIGQAESYIRHVNSMGRTAFKKNGKLKIGYQRGVDDYQARANKARRKLSAINVKLLTLSA